MQRECKGCAHRDICRVFSALQGARHLITELLSRELGASCHYYEGVRRGGVSVGDGAHNTGAGFGGDIVLDKSC